MRRLLLNMEDELENSTNVETENWIDHPEDVPNMEVFFWYPKFVVGR
jgi:hypothetical protein